MTQLVKFDRSNSITRYNQGNGDRLTANADESLLGHCIEERGWSLEKAIQNIKPLSKYEAIHTTRAARIGKVTAVAGFVVGLVGGGTVGAVGMLPLLGAGLAAYVWNAAQACIPRRDLEYSVLKICPQIPEIMLALHNKGASPEVIVSAWDLLLDSYAESEGANAEQVVLEFARLLDHVGRVPELGTVGETPTTATQQALMANSTPALPVAGEATTQYDSRPEAIAPEDGPLSILLATPYQNRLVFGGQRTGKSFLVAIATRYLASKGIKIYHLNLSHTKTSEGRDEDSEYWQHATASIRCDLGSLSAETASSVIDKAIGMVQTFWAQTGAILVVDEGPAQAATSNRHRVLLDPLNALIAAMSSQCNSTGLKRAKSVWAIGPEFVAANMTQHGKSFCKMGSLVHVFIHPASQSEWNGQRLVFDTGLFKQLSTNFQGTILETASAEFCDRAAQIEGSFYSLDGLTLPDWDGKKCVAAAIPNEAKHSSSIAYPPPPDHQGQAEKPKPVIENPAATLEQQIADCIKAYPPGNGGLKLREIKRKFRNEDPKKVEGICLTLARCFPDKFRISEDTIGGNKTIKVEAIP
jgi:hypothetical protein